jgi:hypothetical protein
MPEQEALKLIWNILDDQAFSPIVGYNILGFDLPVIFARSILLGAEATRAIDMRKYGNPDGNRSDGSPIPVRPEEVAQDSGGAIRH